MFYFYIFYFFSMLYNLAYWLQYLIKLTYLLTYLVLRCARTLLSNAERRAVSLLQLGFCARCDR